jgi:hypothetical protein
LIKKVFLLIFITLVLRADFIDDDMDGVENSMDRCPDSSILDIVDKYGCAIEKISLKKFSSYDISMGYYKSSDEVVDNSFSVSFGYTYGDISLYLYNLKYSVETESINNSSIFVYYKFASNAWFGVGTYISDENDDKDDYFVALKRKFFYKDADFTINLKHIFIKDDDTKDSDSIDISLGYSLTNNLYTSFSYYYQTSSYDEENQQTLSFYLNYYFTKHFYISTDYIYGLSDSAIEHIYGISLGYSF